MSPRKRRADHRLKPTVHLSLGLNKPVTKRLLAEFIETALTAWQGRLSADNPMHENINRVTIRHIDYD